jgi:hypothetical protein
VRWRTPLTRPLALRRLAAPEWSVARPPPRPRRASVETPPPHPKAERSRARPKATSPGAPADLVRSSVSASMHWSSSPPRAPPSVDLAGRRRRRPGLPLPRLPLPPEPVTREGIGLVGSWRRGLRWTDRRLESGDEGGGAAPRHSPASSNLHGGYRAGHRCETAIVETAVLSVRFRGAPWRGNAPPHMAPVHFTERPSKSGCKPFLLSFLLLCTRVRLDRTGHYPGALSQGAPHAMSVDVVYQGARPPQAASHDEGPRRRPPSAVLSGLDVVISLHPALPGVELSRVSARLRLHLR